MADTITKSKLLLGEGSHEVAFFDAFLKHLHINDIQVKDYKGKSKLGHSLSALKKSGDFQNITSIGITRDADFFSSPFNTDDKVSANNEARAAFDSVCSALANAGLAKPLLPNQLMLGTPNISVFVFPDCVHPGMLEDLCIEALKSSSGFRCVDEYLACLGNETGHGQPTHLQSKARLRSWLAGMTNDPDYTIGTAAQASIFDFNHPAFTSLNNFIRSI